MQTSYSQILGCDLFLLVCLHRLLMSLNIALKAWWQLPREEQSVDGVIASKYLSLFPRHTQAVSSVKQGGRFALCAGLWCQRGEHCCCLCGIPQKPPAWHIPDITTHPSFLTPSPLGPQEKSVRVSNQQQRSRSTELQCGKCQPGSQHPACVSLGGCSRAPAHAQALQALWLYKGTKYYKISQ